MAPSCRQGKVGQSLYLQAQEGHYGQIPWVLSFNRTTCMNQTTTYVYIDFPVLLTGVCGCTPEGRGGGNGSNGPRIAYYQNDKLLSMLIQNILCWLLGKSHYWSWDEDCGLWSGKDCR